MGKKARKDLLNAEVNRRSLLGYGAAAGLGAVGLRAFDASAQSDKTGADWTPEYIRSIAGTLTPEEEDTKAYCANVVPLDYAGKVVYAYIPPAESEPQTVKDFDAAFWAAFKETYPNIEVETVGYTYNDMLDQVRTAALGGAAPHVAKMPILWGGEFAAKGQLSAFGPSDIGLTNEHFWSGALKSVSWDGQTYGVPTNNETMALIYNSAIFEEAGLDASAPPATWDDLVMYSKTIKEKTGKDGYGLVAKVNAGNTPFRFMPMAWAFGGGALDESTDAPNFQTIMVNNAGTQAAVQACVQMYAVDKSAPASALTNTQAENQAPFIAGQLAMMIAHPSEYAKMKDLASQATGADKEVADGVVANMKYGLIPEGPDRRAVVFGGSNVHVFSPDLVEGGSIDMEAAKALIAFMCSPEWSVKLAWTNSNPSNLDGFKTSWMKERLDTIPNLDVTTSMLPYGIPFPTVAEAPEIMNIIIPEMLQNALTQTMTVEEACNDAAKKIEDLMSGM